MDRVDEMSQDIVKYNTYMRNTSKQQQQKHQVGFTRKFVREFISKYGASRVFFKMIKVLFDKALTVN